MRYAIILKGESSVGDAERKCRSVGATSVSVKKAVRQVFCEMSPAQAATLSKDSSIAVKTVGRVSTDQMVALPSDKLLVQQLSKLSLYEVFAPLRDVYIPGLRGEGLTVAVLDSGIRETHVSLNGKVIYSKDFTGLGSTMDVFGHGTGVAFIIAGEHGTHSGVAPDAKIMNMRVIDNDGSGTEEMVVDGIEETLQKVQSAIDDGLSLTHEDYPNTIHISAGSEDDGDSDNIMRVACRTAIEEYGLEVIASAGNLGPGMSTILCPACEPAVIAVGGIKNQSFTILDYSSRGPTEDGDIKPDLVAWAENIEVASSEADDEYVTKSGTSFSAPILTGVDGLLWDLARRVYGPDMRVKYSDWLEYAYAYCIKPEGTAADKDNTYGYGLPAVGVMVSRLTTPTTGPSALLGTMMPLMMLVMIMPVMMKSV